MSAASRPKLDDLREEMGSVLKRKRNECGLTQGELADRCNTDTSQISAFEKGKRAISADWLFILADGLGCPMVELLPEAQRGTQVQAEERELITIYRHLPPAGQEQFGNLAKAYAMPVSSNDEPWTPGTGELTLTVSSFRDVHVKTPSAA